MAWQKIPGVVGKVYLPDPRGAGKKHPCPDCCSCQHCSQERCRLCRQDQHAAGHLEGACACASGKEVRK